MQEQALVSWCSILKQRYEIGQIDDAGLQRAVPFLITQEQADAIKAGDPDACV